jgi:hypothetical protein
MVRLSIETFDIYTDFIDELNNKGMESIDKVTMQQQIEPIPLSCN